MVGEIANFVEYLKDVKKTSRNTQVSYQRDLLQLCEYLEGQGIYEVSKVTRTSLNSYILYLEREGKATTTISRVLASIKAFFHYEFSMGNIKRDPAELLKAPKIEKKAPVILTVEEIEALMAQPCGRNAKEIRDKAMLELLYATGIRVSELVHLKLEDVNLNVGFITCRDQQKERMVPFGKVARKALQEYLMNSRGILLKGRESECPGKWCRRRGTSRHLR